MGNRAAGYLHALVAAWRTGTRKSQAQVALIMLAIIAASFVVSVTAPEWMPPAAYFVWLLVAMMLLRFRPLVLVGAADATAGVERGEQELAARWAELERAEARHQDRVANIDSLFKSVLADEPSAGAETAV